MAEKSKEPTVRTTLRIPEDLMNEFESITTYTDAPSMNTAICNAIRDKIAYHRRKEAEAQGVVI